MVQLTKLSYPTIQTLKQIYAILASFGQYQQKTNYGCLGTVWWAWGNFESIG